MPKRMLSPNAPAAVTSILVLYDFIVQSILSSFLLLCYNLMVRWVIALVLAFLWFINSILDLSP
jgi:hypothetical protein